MPSVTTTLPALRQRTIAFSAEAIILLAAAVLALTVLAFFCGRWAERTHRRYWGEDRSSETLPGVARPEPLPQLKLAEGKVRKDR